MKIVQTTCVHMYAHTHTHTHHIAQNNYTVQLVYCHHFLRKCLTTHMYTSCANISVEDQMGEVLKCISSPELACP